MVIQLLQADARHIPLRDESVHAVVTSPPYYALRDYKTNGQLGLEKRADCLGWATGQPCGECYICHMVEVFGEVRRVLRADGVAFLNIGDSYAGTGYGKGTGHFSQRNDPSAMKPKRENQMGLKDKDMLLIPSRLALALQASGWWVRSDIIWAKPNPMPESVTDRPTKSHEYIWLLAKSKNYYWDQEAVREPIQDVTIRRLGQSNFDNQKGGAKDPKSGNRSERRTLENLKERYSKEGVWDDRFTGYELWKEKGIGRNVRTVWEIPTQPYSGAHYATYPEELVLRCLKAGCPAGGVVFDPFAGSGTTLLVAKRMGLNAIGCDLSYQYLNENARERIELHQEMLL